MAATQKKSTNTGKRTSTAGKDKRSPQKRGPRTAAEPVEKPFQREVGAAVCLLLAVFSIFGYFNIKAIFIDFFCNSLKGLFGCGFWFVPPMLLVSAYILAFHRGRPVRFRVWCALLFPVVMGVLLHLFLVKSVYNIEWPMFKLLWSEGTALKSGGAFSGALAIFFIAVFSKIGSVIIFILCGALLLLVAFNRSVSELAEAVRSRSRKDASPEEPADTAPPQEVKTFPKEAAAVAGERKPPWDIPVEDGPLVGKEQTSPVPLTKKHFFNKTSSVPAPDQLFAGEAQVRQNQIVPGTGAPAAAVPEPAADPIPEIVREPAIPKAKKGEVAKTATQVAKDIESNLEHEPPAYQYPPVSLLDEREGVEPGEAMGELRLNQARLSDTIRSFGIDAKIVGVIRGPSVTRYEVELDQGVRLNKLTALSDDLALALGATGVRIAPIPDKISMVGIEVPNKLVSPVPIHDVIDSKEFRDHRSKVAFSVGKDIGGTCIVGDIAKLPHLLIAGTTGSGKSVCTNSLIVSLLYKSTPEEVRLIMVDPKMVELGVYNGIPHLLIPVVTDPKKAAGALQWAVTEMMKRYRAFSEVGARDLTAYNAHAAKIEGKSTFPQVVVVIDELADLMLVAAKEVEEAICRVAQMGRAAGMHLIIATQRPSADVITGLMKANIPSRIAFAVASALESRIILDTTGAEKLVGRGDMLWYPLGAGKPTRVQGCLISDEEVAAVVDFVKKSGETKYDDEIIQEIEQHVEEKEKGKNGVGGNPPEGTDDGSDELLPAAIQVVVETGMASVSMLQRRLKLGYSRAARLVDQMEEKGIVGPFEGSKPRQVLITKDQWQEMQFKQGMDRFDPCGSFEGELPPLFEDDKTSEE